MSRTACGWGFHFMDGRNHFFADGVSICNNSYLAPGQPTGEDKKKKSWKNKSEFRPDVQKCWACNRKVA